MKVTWVIGQEIKEHELDIAIVNEVSPSWGSWKTWHDYKTDNCICSNTTDANVLIKQAFHAVCNFYIPQESFVDVGSPQGVKLFDGEFKNATITNKDDIIVLNLVAPTNDIVLMSGFNLSPLDTTNPLHLLIRDEYYHNINELIKLHNTVQFVLVDYKYKLADWGTALPNLSIDDITSVKNLLV